MVSQEYVDHFLTNASISVPLFNFGKIVSGPKKVARKVKDVPRVGYLPMSDNQYHIVTTQASDWSIHLASDWLTGEELVTSIV